MLYPLFAFVGALGVYEFLKIFKTSGSRKKSKYLIVAIILVFSFVSLMKIKPFYLSYMSFLLPKDQIISDGWGYGQYEAAQYLNSLPDAENLVIWSDRSGICQFFTGKCLGNYEIDLSKSKPDYFVFSRRGVLRHRFEWEKPNLAEKSRDYYYKKAQSGEYNWALFIGRRKENFVKIVKY